MSAKNVRKIFYTFFCLVVPLTVYLQLDVVWALLFYRDAEGFSPVPNWDINTYRSYGGGLSFLTAFLGVFVAEIVSHLTIQLLTGKKENEVKEKIKSLQQQGQALFEIKTVPLQQADFALIRKNVRITRKVFVIVAVILAGIASLNLWIFGLQAFVMTLAMGGLGLAFLQAIKEFITKNWREVAQRSEKHVLRGILTDKPAGEGETYLVISSYRFQVDNKTYELYELGDVLEIEFIQSEFTNTVLSHQKIHEGIEPESKRVDAT